MDAVPVVFSERVVDLLSILSGDSDKLAALKRCFWSRCAASLVMQVSSFSFDFYRDPRGALWNCEVRRKSYGGASGAISFEEFQRIPRRRVRFDAFAVENGHVEVPMEYKYSLEGAVLPVFDALSQQKRATELTIDLDDVSVTEMLLQVLHEKTFFSAIAISADSDEMAPRREIFFDFVKDQERNGLCRTMNLSGCWPRELAPWSLQVLKERKSIAILFFSPAVGFDYYESVFEWWDSLENPEELEGTLSLVPDFERSRLERVLGEQLRQNRYVTTVGRHHKKSANAWLYANLKKANSVIDLHFGKRPL
ncbi:hypothetical protein QR680_012490 [Steinernema hermaphroditum]|uniref:Uncharacterized protein n=1 Tax=Steinernema hermaphroditum TaxID=289476 RepID=A0AA39LZX4_9BILA|nr:hypothetical protein QR680_012490 [Steinernema hermaphroditum]